MAADGQHVVTVGFAQTVFGFAQGEPRKTRYCVDYQSRPSTEYMTMISDDGWELVDKSAGWLMWRKDYEGERPEIYTDKQSLIDRNRRLLITLSIVASPQILMLLMYLLDSDRSGHPLASASVWIVYLPVFAFLLFCIVRLCIANHSLKRAAKQ